jgi:TDG/mug DNA glycosylase family protein
MSLYDVPSPLLPDILAYHLDVIFVGAAPSYAAAITGHYYAGPRNRFWWLLYQAGFTPRLLRAEEDAEVLRYGIGLTAILPYVISTDNSRLPPPTTQDRLRLRTLLLHYAPRFVCYNGKDVFRMCTGQRNCPWGLQRERLGLSWQYVVHSTSGRADRWGEDRLYLFRELKQLLNETRPAAFRMW